MRIYVITPIYATTTLKQGATPVVHYFTREWVKMGHEVTVFQITAQYPKFFYWIGKHFQHQLNSRLGMLVPVNCPKDEDYEAEDVMVHRRCFKKLIPHSLYSKRQLNKALEYIIGECNKNGVPDWFIGHWDNPQLELLDGLKKRFGKPTCLVLHDNTFKYERKYGEEGLRMLANMDAIGFRSPVGRRVFEEKYGKLKKSFIASSGVSDAFLIAGGQEQRQMKLPLRNFIYVGSLIERKYPSTILKALSRVFCDGDFSLTYIGDGAEKKTIEEEHCNNGCKGVVRFTGRIPREEIIRYLKQADVFVMISRAEIFGLVYLEAMALGLIPIGSKHEGIDGIICDGENGFLCDAGSEEGLVAVLERIEGMSLEQLKELSNKAKETAQEYSDRGVAERYLNSII